MSLRPEVRPHPTDPNESLLNASAVIELARRSGTPQSRAFLKAYHAAEREVARRSPHLSEGRIRGEAVVLACKAIGAKVTLDGKVPRG